MIARLLYTLFWLYLLNPLVVAIVLAGLQAIFFPSWAIAIAIVSTVAISILWYHIWMWVRVKNRELDDSVRKSLGL